MNKNITNIFALLLMISCICCQIDSGPLPILGHTQYNDGDTIYHTIPDFKFTNQDGKAVTQRDLQDYVYISDFFFTSCPSICPKVKKQMLRIYDKYKTNPRIKLVSHTIDPKRDTPERLNKYANDLNVKTSKWMFLTGNKDSLLDIAESYFVSAFEDADAPGGFDHSGKIIVTDTKKHIRAFAEGTDPDDVSKLLKEIDILLNEYD